MLCKTAACTPLRQSLPLEGKVPSAVRRLRWGANHCKTLWQWQSTNPSSTVNTKPQNQTAARRHCNNPAAAGNVPPHQSPDGDSFPSRGSQTSRQKADLSTKVNKKGAPICFSQQNGCAFFSARFPVFFTPWAFSNKCTSRPAPARRRPECCPGSPESGWTPAPPR